MACNQKGLAVPSNIGKSRHGWQSPGTRPSGIATLPVRVPTTMPTPTQSPCDIVSEDLKDFIAAATIVGDLALPQRYPRPGGLEDLQIGYRVHGITGETLVSMAPGGWQPGWIVIAANEFADPFFIDAGEGSRGFPVYYAPHGAGRWEATCVAPTLRRFAEILATLCDLEGEAGQALRFIEAETDATNPLWREIIQSRRESDAEDGDAAGPDPDLSAIADHDLVIVDIGPRKLEVVRILRRALRLGLHEALGMAAQRDIVVQRGPRVRLERMAAELADAGAAVALRLCCD